MILKKKKIVLYVFLSVFVVLGCFLLLYSLFLRSSELDFYTRLSEHCTEEVEGTKECYVFLNNHEIRNGKLCLEIILPEIEVEKRDITACFEDYLEWENPYEDYSLAVPVVLSFDYEKLLFGNYSFTNVGIDLISDELVFELLEDIYSYSEEAILVRTKALNEKILRGYDYYPQMQQGEEKPRLYLRLINVRLESMERKGDKIEMEIYFQMDNSQYSYNFNTIEFSLSIPGKGMYFLDFEDEIEDYLDLEKIYSIDFLLFDLQEDEFFSKFNENLHDRVKRYFGTGENGDVDLRLRGFLE